MLRKNLCSALLQCHLNYCCSVWLARWQDPNCRLLFRARLNLRPGTHIGQLTRSSINLMNIQDHVSQQRLNHVFNVFNDIRASYLANNFVRTHQANCIRSSSYNFIVPRVQGMVSKSIFYKNSILDWNALPPNIQSISSRMKFRKLSRKTELIVPR